jgi:hypothetical protein
MTRRAYKDLPEDLASARLREVQERADNLMLKNAVLRGELLERTEMIKAGEAFMISLKALIETFSSLSKAEKETLLEQMASWPVVVKNAAERQARQIRVRPEKTGNGDEETD